jgi:hypothetical protein
VRTEPIFFFPLGTEDREREDEDDALVARRAEETPDDATARADVGTDTAATIPDDMARTGVRRRGVWEERVEMAKVIHFLFRLSCKHISTYRRRRSTLRRGYLQMVRRRHETSLS